MVKILVICNVLCWLWGFCKFRFLSFFRSLFAFFSLFTLYISSTSFLVERYFNLFLMEWYCPLQLVSREISFISLKWCSKAFVLQKVPVYVHFPELRAHRILELWSLESLEWRLHYLPVSLESLCVPPTPHWHKVTIETNFKTIKLVRFMF